LSRQDQYNVAVSVDGRDLGTFDKFDGGEMDSDETKYRPGGMQPQVSLGGQSMVNNVTVSRLYNLGRDHQLMPWLLARVGKVQAIVKKQPLDVDGNPFGDPLVYRGKLKQVTAPPADSESNDAALLALEVSSGGTIG
jgi:hypothetical protein